MYTNRIIFSGIVVGYLWIFTSTLSTVPQTFDEWLPNAVNLDFHSFHRTSTHLYTISTTTSSAISTSHPLHTNAGYDGLSTIIAIADLLYPQTTASVFFAWRILKQGRKRVAPHCNPLTSLSDIIVCLYYVITFEIQERSSRICTRDAFDANERSAPVNFDVGTSANSARTPAVGSVLAANQWRTLLHGYAIILAFTPRIGRTAIHNYHSTLAPRLSALTITRYGKRDVAMTPMNINHIRLDGRTNTRAKINQHIVREYAQCYRSGVALPPVVVYRDDDGHYWLADGFHRVHAARHAGMQSIDADVRNGNRRDALIYAASNQDGLPKSIADRYRAVRLLCDECPSWSYEAIAAMCCVSLEEIIMIRNQRMVWSRPVMIEKYR